jgi:hypothetical protein
MGVRPLSRVELMLWVRSVTIKIVMSQNLISESHIGHILSRTELY